MWENQIPAFTGVGYRFIAYDRRAEGSAVDDLEALAAHLVLDRFHLVGTAAGGIVAVDYALTHPERLRSLVIANSIVGVQDEEYLEMTRRLRAVAGVQRDPGRDPRARAVAIARRTPKARGAGKSCPSTSRRKPRKTASPSRRWSTITIPTLLLTGDADLYTPPSVLRLLAARFPNCQSLVIPECGHSAFWEQPEAFNQAVLDFISKH